MAEGLTDQDLANLEMQTSMAGIKRTSEAAGIDLTPKRPYTHKREVLCSAASRSKARETTPTFFVLSL